MQIWQKVEESNSIINGTKINEDENKFTASFQVKDEESWNNIKIKLLKFYQQYNVKDITSDKEKSWMLGSSDMPGYIEVKLDEDIITVVSFKLPKPDISIIKSETKEKDLIK